MAGYTGIAGGSETNVGSNVAYNIPLPAPDIGQTPGTFYNPTAPDGPGLYQSWRFPDVVLQRPNYDSGAITEKQYQQSNQQSSGEPLPNIHMAFDGGLATPTQQRPNVNYGFEAYSRA